MEKSKSLAQWSMWAGGLAVLSFILSVFTFYGDAMIASFDHKDFYFAGIGLITLAIWFKLGAIYHKG